MPNLYLAGLGAFYAIEGAANVLKGPDTQNKLWKAGRVLRTLGGIALVGASLVL